MLVDHMVYVCAWCVRAQVLLRGKHRRRVRSGGKDRYGLTLQIKKCKIYKKSGEREKEAEEKVIKSPVL